MNQAAPFLQDIQRKFEAVFDAWIPEGERCALLNVADYPNVGDSAIFLGELAYLKRRNVELVQCSTTRTFDEDGLRRELGNGTILLQGGGSFGDLYPAHHAFRERIARAFPNNRIITFPVTWKFRDDQALQRSQRILGGHGGFFLTVRDVPSYEKARASLDVEVALSPDAAFALGPLSRQWEAKMPIRILGRTDEEADQDLPADVQTQAVDWLQDPLKVRGLHVASRLTWLLGQPEGLVGRRADRLTVATAQQRFDFGSHLLADGKVVVSDRLHAAIMSTLRGIPVFMVGDKYGKLKNFYEAWLSTAPTVTWNDDFASAMAAANQYLEK